ncbi:MAG: 1-deoxy-D-xylulose-5-phosphate reductoisomerase [Rickettsiales bacterium]|jgi:1-deoxy-D-xylulose-5-phosphate reductoisomerase
MNRNRKSIAIFGSTGSIGVNALKVVSQHLDSYEVQALAAGSDVKSLIEQAKIFKPKYAAINNESHFSELKAGLKDFPEIEILAGSEAINNLAQIKFDFFLSAIVGIAGLIPTFNAIKAGSDIGMANKECLVAAGDLMLDAAKKSGSKILPIDSEHNAIFQIFEQQNFDKIKSITLTASGGPFLNFSQSEMKNITVAQAIKHPNWKMGAKISVDSATMMNKSLEVIEAFRLFPVKQEQIEVIIHPESIIHGMVDYSDGSTLAMLSAPNMQVPIAHALSYPSRIAINHPKLDLAKIASLNFQKPDEKQFPALKLVREVLEIGGNAPCVFNAANEIAVAKFLKEEISFSQIVGDVEKALNKIPFRKIQTLEDVIACNQIVHS